MTMSDHERIFLAPLDEPEDPYQGRMWCEDCSGWESPGVEFIRLDLHDAALVAATERGRQAGLREAMEINRKSVDWSSSTAGSVSCGIASANEAIRARIKEGPSE
jgi:hypothetical protein